MEVLFEYRGSRRQLTASSGENLVECITTELHRIGRARAQVYTANVDLSTVDRSREVYLLQRWSPQWGCYLDVNQASEITDGDRLAVVIKPKPPSKFLLLCCCCSSAQNQPQVQGVPRSKKNAVRKNEEIQALDYMFNVESGRQSPTSEREQTQSPAPSEAVETDLNEGEQYVRAESGRASWKLVPTKSSDDLTEPQQPASDLVEQTDFQEQESENNSAPPLHSETDDTTGLAEGSSEQATGKEEGGEEGAKIDNKLEDAGEQERTTATEDNPTDDQPNENAEINAAAAGEKSTHEEQGDLDNTNEDKTEPMPTGVDEQKTIGPSGEISEPSRDREITEAREANEELQQESLNDSETKASGDEVQATCSGNVQQQ